MYVGVYSNSLIYLYDYMCVGLYSRKLIYPIVVRVYHCISSSKVSYYSTRTTYQLSYMFYSYYYAVM